MKTNSILRSFLVPRPPTPGLRAPSLSLTSHDGGWIQSKDFLGERQLLLLFISHLHEQHLHPWLQSYNNCLASLEDAGVTVLGIAPARIDKLREFRAALGLDFHLLYDPLAIESRRFCMTGRRPTIKVGAVLINKQGWIAFADTGLVPPREIQHALDQEQSSNEEKSDAVQMISSDFAMSLMEQDFRLVDVRTAPEFEADHVPNSIHLPLDELENKVKKLDELNRLIFICQAGGRAWNAAEFTLSIGGQNICVVEGGMSSWNGPRRTGGKISTN